MLQKMPRRANKAIYFLDSSKSGSLHSPSKKSSAYLLVLIDMTLQKALWVNINLNQNTPLGLLALL
jgi:hypothetical protein